MTVTLSNGQRYEFAPLKFTESAVQLLECVESEGSENFKRSAFLRILRDNMTASLRDGGHTDADIDEAFRSITFSGTLGDALAPIMRAMMPPD